MARGRVDGRAHFCRAAAVSLSRRRIADAGAVATSPEALGALARHLTARHSLIMARARIRREAAAAYASSEATAAGHRAYSIFLYAYYDAITVKSSSRYLHAQVTAH